jgi:hypothetical protein
VWGAVSYGGLAALIDYFHEGRTTVFRGRTAPARASGRLAPMITADRKGLVAAFEF